MSSASGFLSGFRSLSVMTESPGGKWYLGVSTFHHTLKVVESRNPLPSRSQQYLYVTIQGDIFGGVK